MNQPATMSPCRYSWCKSYQQRGRCGHSVPVAIETPVQPLRVAQDAPEKPKPARRGTSRARVARELLWPCVVIVALGAAIGAAIGAGTWAYHVVLALLG